MDINMDIERLEQVYETVVTLEQDMRFFTSIAYFKVMQEKEAHQELSEDIYELLRKVFEISDINYAEEAVRAGYSASPDMTKKLFKNNLITEQEKKRIDQILMFAMARTSTKYDAEINETFNKALAMSEVEMSINTKYLAQLNVYEVVDFVLRMNARVLKHAVIENEDILSLENLEGITEQSIKLVDRCQLEFGGDIDVDYIYNKIHKKNQETETRKKRYLVK